ncbi:BQ2448_7680 [Microbotryum intermedium]|uniref:BQ2448_7680 protein n=1 Tax=Microbotryum intermedium TaxID=269621 RepID=A0A238FR24_9BASI|nr:BQ2448_7680 [Microbotryum intermedium]
MRSPDSRYQSSDGHGDDDYDNEYDYDASTPTTPTTAMATPAQSGIHLAPNPNVSFEHMLEGEVPNVLADRVLALHDERPSAITAAGSGDGSDSGGQDRTLHPGDRWFNSLTRSLSSHRGHEDEGGRQQRARSSTKLDSETETDHLLGDADNLDLGDGHRFAPDVVAGDSEESSTHSLRKRPTISRSSSTTRRLRWYQRPSPWFFIPGTLIMALSMGMTISPKVEIYYQLVCRNIGPEKSGVTLSPPLVELGQRVPRNRLAALSPNPDDRFRVHRFVERAMKPQHFEFTSSATSGDSWSKQCHKSVPVQQGVTSLVSYATSLSFIMGLLSALTTGYYGSLSDRRGRRPVLVLAMFGTIVMDAVVLITVQYHHIVGYRFLILGPVIDGLLGGATTAQATSNAYLADCTDAGSRARIFSVLGGVIFAGIAIGPTLGAILVRQSGSIILPFYVALAMHITYASVMLFVIPESLTKTRQHAARERHAEERAARHAAEDEEARKAKVNGAVMVVVLKVKRIALRPWGFLKPVGLMMPRKRDPNEMEEDRPMLDAMGPVKAGWDFSLLKISIAVACFSMGLAVYQVKLLYTSYRFGWGAEENGLYLSFIGVCRVVGLIIVLPLFIRAVRKPAPLPPRPRPEGEFDTAGPATVTKEQKLWDREATWLRTLHDSHFDLFLAKLSLLIDIMGYALLALNGGSPTRFLVATGCSIFGGGASAAIQSLALAHTSTRDSGRLFAGLSVLSSVNGQIVGPLMFGSVFIGTVEKLPETTFWVLVGVLTIGLCTIMTIRLRKKVNSLEELLDAENGSTS